MARRGHLTEGGLEAVEELGEGRAGPVKAVGGLAVVGGGGGQKGAGSRRGLGGR